MPRKAWKQISFEEADLEAAQRAAERARDLEGVGYDSVTEFIRDALRRRVEAINEAWRSHHSTISRMGLQEPRKTKKEEGSR